LEAKIHKEVTHQITLSLSEHERAHLIDGFSRLLESKDLSSEMRHTYRTMLGALGLIARP